MSAKSASVSQGSFFLEAGTEFSARFLIDGQDVKTLHFASFRRFLGIVPQALESSCPVA